MVGKSLGPSVRKKIVFSLLPALALLCGAELALRLADYRSPIEDPYESFVLRRPLFESQGDRLRTRRARVRWFHDTTLTSAKPDGSLRGFVVGGSAVHGYRLSDPAGSSFPAVLERELEADPSHGEVQIVNCGGLSYASYRLVHVVEEIVAYSPDFVVVMTGHNEFLEPRHYAAVMARTSVPWFQRLRLVVFAHTLAARLASGEGAAETEPVVRNEPYEKLVVRDAEEVRRTLEHFERNLERMIDLCRERDVPIVLVTPPSNLRDHAPFYTLTDLDSARAAQLTGGIRHWLELGDHDRALQAAREALAEDDGAAVFHYLAARSLDGLGRLEESARHYTLARDTDGFPHRATSALNAATRRVARERGVLLLDGEELFAAEARDGIPGADLFFDNCHPTEHGHALLAHELAALLERDVLAR